MMLTRTLLFTAAGALYLTMCYFLASSVLAQSWSDILLGTAFSLASGGLAVKAGNL